MQTETMASAAVDSLLPLSVEDKPAEATLEREHKAQDPNVLSIQERHSLAAHEAAIEPAHGRTAYVEIGRALKEIRDDRLYRETFKTFERYVKARFGMSRASAYRFID